MNSFRCIDLLVNLIFAYRLSDVKLRNEPKLCVFPLKSMISSFPFNEMFLKIEKSIMSYKKLFYTKKIFNDCQQTGNKKKLLFILVAF